SVFIIGEDPPPHLRKVLTRGRPIGFDLSLETTDGIDQHRHHQATQRFYRPYASATAVELQWQDRLSLREFAVQLMCLVDLRGHIGHDSLFYNLGAGAPLAAAGGVQFDARGGGRRPTRIYLGGDPLHSDADDLAEIY